MNPIFDLARSMSHDERNTQFAASILAKLAALPPSHPECDEYTNDDGLVTLKCFYTFEKGASEDAVNPAEPDAVTLHFCYVGNVNIMAGLTSAQKMAIEEEIMMALS